MVKTVQPDLEYSDVAECCERLMAQGVEPSTVEIYKSLARGSKGTVQRLLTEWEKTLIVETEASMSEGFLRAYAMELSRHVESRTTQCNTRIQVLNDRCIENADDLTEMETKYAVADNARDIAETRVRELELELAAARETIRVQSAQLETFESRLLETNRLLEQIKGERDQDRNHLELARKQIADHKDSLLQLQKEKSTLASEANLYQQRLAVAEARNEEQARLAEQSAKQFEQASHQLADFQKVVSELQLEMERVGTEARQQVVVAEARLAEQLRHSEFIEKQLDAAEQRSAELMAANQQMHSILVDAAKAGSGEPEKTAKKLSKVKPSAEAGATEPSAAAC